MVIFLHTLERPFRKVPALFFRPEVGMFYGIVHRDQPRQYAQAVCDVLGHGENRLAVRMLLETCAQETHMGQFVDASAYRHGVSLYQIDEIAFQNVMARTRDADKNKIKDSFGIVLDDVEYRELAFSPLLATIFARLHYKLIPEPFPADVESRARYWKKHYNTTAGKGTEAEYLLNAKRFLS